MPIPRPIYRASTDGRYVVSAIGDTVTVFTKDEAEDSQAIYTRMAERDLAAGLHTASDHCLAVAAALSLALRQCHDNAAAVREQRAGLQPKAGAAKR